MHERGNETAFSEVFPVGQAPWQTRQMIPHTLTGPTGPTQRRKQLLRPLRVYHVLVARLLHATIHIVRQIDALDPFACVPCALANLKCATTSTNKRMQLDKRAIQPIHRAQSTGQTGRTDGAVMRHTKSRSLPDSCVKTA